MYRRPLTVILSALVMVVVKTQAQNPRIGFVAGLNITSMHFSPPPSAFSTNITVHSKAGVMLGAALHLPVSKRLHVQTGLLYDMKGLKLSGQKVELRYTYHYFDIPLFLQYSYKGMFAGAGPYLGTVLGGKVKFISVDTNLTEKIPVGSDPDSDGIRRIDWGLNFRAGYELPAGVVLFAQYGLGIANVEPAVNTSEHHRAFTIGICYFIKPKQRGISKEL